MQKNILENWEKKSKERQKIYKSYLQNANKNKILSQQQSIHNEAFENISCLQCANCCKNYSPRFKPPDIKRIAKSLGLKESTFIDTYLYMDEEGDHVLKTLPCPFLEADNSCRIYEDRPSDCKRFPYSDEDVFFKRMNITLKNSTFCPITYYTIEKLIEKKSQV